MAELPLAQWFDLTKPISRDGCDLVEAEMMLRHYKDCGDAPCEHRCNHPDCKEARRTISDLYVAVKQHSKPVHAARMLKFQTEIALRQKAKALLVSRGSPHSRRRAVNGSCAN